MELTEQNIKNVLKVMGYKVRVFKGQVMPIELMNDALEIGGRFWSFEHAYRAALKYELDQGCGHQELKNFNRKHV